MKRKIVALFVSLTVAFLPALTFAQDASKLSEDERQTLGRLFSEARDAFDARDYPTSIARLDAAYAIFPEPGILYRIAEMYESLGENEQAATYYSRYIAAKPEAEDRDVIEARIRRLNEPKATPTEFRRARMTIVTTPSGANVRVGEEDLGETPLEVELAPGEYRIRLEKSGHRALVKTFELKADELRTVEYDLDPVTVEAPAEQADEGSAWAWTLGLGATGVAAAGASVGFFLTAADRQASLDEWDAARTTMERPAQYDETLDEELTYRSLGWAFAGVAALSVGAATTVWLLSEDGGANASLQVTPGRISVVGTW